MMAPSQGKDEKRMTAADIANESGAERRGGALARRTNGAFLGGEKTDFGAEPRGNAEAFTRDKVRKGANFEAACAAGRAS